MIIQKYQKGFTIPELMMGIALFAIIVNYAVPSFETLMRRQELSSKLGELNTLMAYARTEAVSRAKNVIVCPADPDSIGCLGSNDWSSAWRVYVDLNDDGVFDSDDQLIRESGDYGRRVQLTSNSTAPIIYNDAGESEAGRTVNFCVPGADANSSRRLLINNVGSTRVTTGSGC